jgi:hypothetical protein
MEKKFVEIEIINHKIILIYCNINLYKEQTERVDVVVTPWSYILWVPISNLGQNWLRI